MEVFQVIEFFQSLVDYIRLFVNFLITMFHNLMTLLNYVPRSLTTLARVLGMLPPFLTVPILGIIGISVTITVINLFKGD